MGLGGYTAVKALLKNKQFQGAMRDYAQRAMYEIETGTSQGSRMARAVMRNNYAVQPTKIKGGADGSNFTMSNGLIENNKIAEFNISQTLQSLTGVKSSKAEADLTRLYQKHPEIFQNEKEVFKLIKEVLTEATHFVQGSGKNNTLVLANIDNKLGKVGLNREHIPALIVHALKSSKKDTELRRLISRQMEGSPTPSLPLDGTAAHGAKAHSSAMAEIIPQNQKDVNINLAPSLGGGAFGGSDALINQRDYDGDGEFTYKDLLIGAGLGAGGAKALQKAKPDWFKNDFKDTDAVAGMFTGAKPTDKGAFSDVATKKMMREIDDRGSRVKPFQKDKISHRLDEVLEHPELFEKYPELKNIYVSRGDINAFDGKHIKIKDTEVIESELRKQYNALEDRLYKEAIELEKRGLLTPQKEAEFTKEIDDFAKYVKENDTEVLTAPNKSTLLHEIQHAIQSKEGWAKGGNAESAGSMDNYQRLWGEQQARATEHRANYTPEQRMGESWTDTLAKQEGAYNEPIIKYDDGVANMATELESRYIKNGLVDEKAIAKDASEFLPQPVKNIEEFTSLLKSDGKGNYVDTPIGRVNVNARQAYNHLIHNTHFEDRAYISGAFAKTLNDPLFVVEKLYNGKPSTVFYKPFKQDGKVTHLASFAVSKDGLVHKTFYEIDSLKKMESLLRVPNKDMLYYKHSLQLNKGLEASHQQKSWRSAHNESISQPKENVNPNMRGGFVNNPFHETLEGARDRIQHAVSMV